MLQHKPGNNWTTLFLNKFVKDTNSSRIEGPLQLQAKSENEVSFWPH